MQFDIERRMRRLDWAKLEADLFLDYHTIRALREVSRAKMNLRDAILSFVHELMSSDRKPRGWRETLGTIIGQVEALNAEIERADWDVNPRLRKTRRPSKRPE